MSGRSSSARRWREPQLCVSCRETIQHWKRFCDACWTRVPPDLRARIIQAGRDKAPHTASALALAAVERMRKADALERRKLGEREDA